MSASLSRQPLLPSEVATVDVIHELRRVVLHLPPVFTRTQETVLKPLLEANGEIGVILHVVSRGERPEYDHPVVVRKVGNVGVGRQLSEGLDVLERQRVA